MRTKKHLYSIRYHFVLLAAVFLLSAVAGYSYGIMEPSSSELLMEELFESFAPLADLPSYILALTIFLRNSSLCLISLILGLGIGAVPLLFITLNGFVIGMIVYAMKEATGFGFVILSILPHGVVELPTVILSAAIGVKLGQVVFLSLLGRKPNIIEEFFNGMRTFFCFILPLLLLAALIEVYITPHLL